MWYKMKHFSKRILPLLENSQLQGGNSKAALPIFLKTKKAHL